MSSALASGGIVRHRPNMEPWIFITIGAALAQSLRFMLQKQLKTTALSTAGTTFARFVYSAPFVAIAAMLYARGSGQGVPDLPPAFFGYAALGGLSQIFWTVCFVALFMHHHIAALGQKFQQGVAADIAGTTSHKKTRQSGFTRIKPTLGAKTCWDCTMLPPMASSQ